MGCYFSLFCTKWFRSFGLTQVIVRSFALMQKNQKIKAHTPEATVAKISENSLRSNSRDFLTLRSVDRLTPPPLGRNNGQLRIENL